MEQLTLALDPELARALDALRRDRGYEDRAGAIEDLVRAQLDARDVAAKASSAERIATCTWFHRPGDAGAAAEIDRLRAGCGRIVAALAHDLADGSRFECLVLVGPEVELRGFVDALTAVRGVRRARYAAHPLPRGPRAPARGRH